MSLGETMLRPTAMLFRNLASMDVEESIRGNPHGRRRVAHGMRQDDAFADDGRRQRAICRRSACQAARCSRAFIAVCTIWFRHERSGDDRSGAHRDKSRWKNTAKPKLHAPLPRALHDHGNGLDDGGMVEALGVGMPGNAAIPAVDARRNLSRAEAGAAS